MYRQRLTWTRAVRLADKYGTIGLRWVLALVGICFATAPYLYMTLQSLAPWREVNRRIIPTELTTRSYEWLLQGSATAVARPWLRGFGNSVLVTSISTVSMLVVAMLAGYALSRLRFRGREAIYKFILFQMFYPGIILLVPRFLIVRQLGLYNTYAGMIVPLAVNIWAIFMYVSFFKSINPAMLEAARIDGASEMQVLFRIVLPLSGSITAVIGLFLFMERWVELIWGSHRGAGIPHDDPKRHDCYHEWAVRLLSRSALCRQRDLDHTDHFGLSHLQQAFHPRIQVCPEVGAGGGKALEKAAWGAAFQGGLPECLLRRRRGTFRIRGVPCFMPAVDLVLGSTVGSFLQSAASPQILLFHREVPCHEFLPISAAALLRSPFRKRFPNSVIPPSRLYRFSFGEIPAKLRQNCGREGGSTPTAGSCSTIGVRGEKSGAEADLHCR